MVDPNWITGFTDGEGCFSLFVHKDKHKRKNGEIVTYYRWSAVFIIGLRGDDGGVIEKFKDFFECGYITRTFTKETAHLHDYGKIYFQTRSIPEISNIIVPHFDNYPLNSKKQIDYLLWREGVKIMKDSRENSQRFQKIIYTEVQTRRLSAIHIEMRKRVSGSRRDWDYKNIDLDGIRESTPALGQGTLF